MSNLNENSVESTELLGGPRTRQSTRGARPEPRFKAGDTVITASAKVKKGRRKLRVLVKLEKRWWSKKAAKWRWDYEVTAESGEVFTFWSSEARMEKPDYACGDHVKLQVNNQEVNGVIEKVFVNDENQVSYDVRYGMLVTTTSPQLKRS